jgi:hypothetical protein
MLLASKVLLDTGQVVLGLAHAPPREAVRDIEGREQQVRPQPDNQNVHVESRAQNRSQISLVSDPPATIKASMPLRRSFLETACERRQN